MDGNVLEGNKISRAFQDTLKKLPTYEKGYMARDFVKEYLAYDPQSYETTYKANYYPMFSFQSKVNGNFGTQSWSITRFTTTLPEGSSQAEIAQHGRLITKVL